ncbi:Uncharacterised protein [Mycobacteroides abscessus subsp. abscessus]|nr:Uncharacterised protein [Mycobacteroides abscessus subsp. abscessus]SKP80133.1 Uncharacterised protein [Mycobacteroides abscessus subsp. abscessus]
MTDIHIAGKDLTHTTTANHTQMQHHIHAIDDAITIMGDIQIQRQIFDLDPLAQPIDPQPTTPRAVDVLEHRQHQTMQRVLGLRPGSSAISHFLQSFQDGFLICLVSPPTGV